MNDDLETLGRIARAMLDPEREVASLIPEAVALRDWFEERAPFQIAPERDITAGESWLESGRAVSPTMAALCLRELARTAAFVRGLGMAIRDAMQPDRPVRVLYAGCGPYATLAVPLMAIFSAEQVRFTLMDVHLHSVMDAKSLIVSLGLADRIEAFLQEDAARYSIPEESRPDIIVSETMASCLRDEPQVAIARHLLMQAPEARMVPQSISVEACLLDVGKEHVFMPADHEGEIPEPQRDRIPLGMLFELDAENIRGWEKLDGDRLPAGRITLPAEPEARYRLNLLTRIAVYGDIVLQDYNTGLTMPYPLRGKFRGGESLQFHYLLGEKPGLQYEAVA